MSEGISNCSAVSYICINNNPPESIRGRVWGMVSCLVAVHNTLHYFLR